MGMVGGVVGVVVVVVVVVVMVLVVVVDGGTDQSWCLLEDMAGNVFPRGISTTRCASYELRAKKADDGDGHDCGVMTVGRDWHA